MTETENKEEKPSTPVDILIKFYMRFVWGFGILAVWIGLLNFGMVIVTMVTVKGVYIPLWAIPAVAVAVLIFCTLVGHYFEKWDIWNRMTSHGNKAANPEISAILSNTAESKTILEDIKKILEEKPE